MSSYRSYVPWKTSLSPSTYKSGSGSNYSSRDDVSTTSDSKPSASSTPRFGSIASPAAYRPSYSGGTYRSVPIKRDTGLSSYTTRYTTTPTASTPVATSTTSSTTTGTPSSVTSAKEEKTKSSSSESSKKTSSKYSTKDASAKKSSSKYTTSGKDSSATSESRLSRLSTSTSNLSKYGRTSRDPSPATTNLTSTSKYSRKSREPSPITTTLTSSGKYTRKSSRDPSPVTSTLTSTSKYVKKSRDPSPLTTTLTSKYGRQSRDTSPVNSSTSTSATSNLTRYRAASRDPSPGERKSSLALARGRSRDPSPLITTTLRGRSRDPSPAESLKERISSATSGYSSSYRLFPKSSSGYSSKYDTNSALTRTSMPDKALSYMSSSDIRARSVGRQRERVERQPRSSVSESTEVVALKSEESRSELETTQETTESEESDENESFVSVTVVTRGTSPTPPNSTTVVRNRRTDLAKTIEKTIQKSTKKRHLVDKEIQSDRMDDPTRYSRFSGTSRTTSIPWSSYLDTKFSGSTASSRYSPSKTSRDSTSKSETDSSEKKKKTEVERLKKDELSSSKESISLSRSNSSRSISKLGKSSTPESKTKSSKSSSGQKQKSPESPTATSNLVSRALPPTVPKTEVPTKPGSASSVSNVKWPNKDFRKSALNVGPTDRPRKSRTPSTSTDTDEKNDQAASKSASPLVKTPASLERSPSVASEASSNGNSATSSSLSEDEQKRPPPTNANANANAKTSQALASQFLDEDISLPKDKTVNSYYKTSPNATSSGASKNKQAINARQTSTPTLSSTNIRTESPAPVATKIDEAKSYLIRKLGSVSNIFIRNEDSSGETVYLDNTSSSLSNETKENATNAANAAVSVTATISLPKRVNPELSTTVNISNHTKTPTPTPISSNSKSDQDLEDSSWWQNTSQQIDTDSALDLRDDMKYKLRHIDSGELAWWNRNDEDETIAEDIKTYQDDPDRSENTDPSSLYINNNTNSNSKHSNDQQWSITINDINEPINIDNATQSSGNSNKLMPNKIRHIQSGELPWWSTDNCIEGVQDLTLNETTNRSSKTHSNSPKNLSPKDYLSPEKSPSNRSLYKIRHNQSGEKAWWLNDSKSNSPTTETNQRSTPSREKNWWVNGTINETKGSPQRESYSSPTASKKQYKIRHIESGEKAWWMQDDSSERQQPQQQPAVIEEHEYPNQMQYEEEEEEEHVANDEEIQNVTMKNYKNYNPPSHHDYFALGDRASPEGLEDTTAGRKSPYDNIPGSTTAPQQQQFQPNRSDAAHKLFISRHKNIDELLGGSCRPLSPLMDRFSGRNMFIEEVTPEQVRIHDSTAQIAVIQRMERDPWEFDFNAHLQNQNHQMLDDAAIQVYKDGDYGAYLDLESSLAEQAEEIEGLNSSRKNSLVVRTQLSVRVHAIIEKLLSSEGSELRRALFSLKQIFQEDKDLVHGFVALGGLNCLVRVGNGADQNYQNYILRALGQVMLYVDGMNGVMKHGPTIQWLYSLIASKYRLVVKTALKLLLVFVEYTESNCYLLVNAIHAVDKIHGTVPWSNIMKLLKDYENADTELLIYATSLINKTLSGLSDQDSFYDESDHLEQQGMEGVIQRYMSRPGTDLDLLDQLQLYEAVLKFEDGESDGIHRIHDNSIRKTLRYRSTDSTERRKSRRHSTGTSPMSQNMSTQKRYTPPVGQVLDEDSSSSNNSNEFNAFRDSKGSSQREGAGVTPGLRRRRERAERQKTFMREQQEAAANGIRSPFEKRDDLNGLGQIVTAVPVHLQNGSDSPPESLNPTINTDKTHHNNHRHMNNSNDNHSIPSKTVYSPTKAVLTNTNISVISNGFDKKATNNTNNLSCDKPANTNSNGSVTNGMMSKRHGSDYASNKSHAMRTNSANVINGLMKNINRNDPNDNNNYSSHKKFEHDSNRLNSFYNQLSSTKNNHYTGSKLSHKNLNTPTSNGTNSTTKNTSNGRIPVKHKDPVQTQASLNQNNVTNGSQNLTSDTVITNGNGNNHAISNGTNGNGPLTDSADSDSENKRSLLQLKKDQTVKDITQKLTNLPMSPQEEKPQSRLGDMTGLISKAKEGLAKSKSKGEISRSPSTEQEIKKAEPKKSENELHWEELVRSLSRPLNLCDLDFTDLNSEDEKDVLAPRSLGGPVPPPPPPIGMPPPPMAGMCPPPPFNGMAPPPGAFPPPLSNLVPPPCFNFNQLTKANGEVNSSTIKKNKKTVKLFWKEVREDMIPPTVGKTIWDELPDSAVDTQKLEHLFESRAKDLMTKKQQELNKNKEIIVLDHKRSNAINIAMTKLPPPRAIKAAILKMDATVVTREGIDKLLNMLPTDEERGKIQEAQMSNPELPLGSAEQFLLTLSSISELAARLKLWAFKLDFENSEREIAEPLMDLKQGLELLKANKTFKCILSTLLSIGIFLNGAPVKGFQIEYLSKVPEVKDTVHKHSLLHHLCHMVMETSPDTTDLYSEIGPITRASKADFTELAHSLIQLETECKSSWDRLKLIAKHDCPTQLKQKLVDFLADCAERIIILQIVHRRVINRYRKFLLWLGIPLHRIPESKPNEFCRIVSEFALEYRTTRERVHQQIEKKANHRERNKTRGKMIIDVAKFRTQEDRADAELKQLLGSPNPGTENTDGTLTWRRRRAENLRSPIIKQNEESFTDGDDEILESLVKTATKASGPRPTPRERKRTRHADRKSLRRTLKNGLTEEEKQQVSSLIKTY